MLDATRLTRSHIPVLMKTRVASESYNYFELVVSARVATGEATSHRNRDSQKKKKRLRGAQGSGR